MQSEPQPVSTTDYVTPKWNISLQVIALEEYDSVEELLTAGGTSLKYTLQSMGLKCGGTVLERAKRLFSVKGKTLKEIDPSLLAKGCKLKIKNQE